MKTRGAMSFHLVQFLIAAAVIAILVFTIFLFSKGGAGFLDKIKNLFTGR